MNQLLDRHFELVSLERSTLATYRGYADKHIRPLIGSVQVGALDADVFDAFYAELRRCRDPAHVEWLCAKGVGWLARVDRDALGGLHPEATRLGEALTALAGR